MSYLQRRINFLLQKVKTGEIVFAENIPETGEAKKLLDDLEKIIINVDGSVDLSSCSPRIRSFARVIYNLNRRGSDEDDETSPKSIDKVTPDLLINETRNYFNLIDSFFSECIGKPYHEFDSKIPFNQILKNDADKYLSRADNMRSAFVEYLPKIKSFHSQFSNIVYKSKDTLAGVLCVIGGSSRFPMAAVDSIRKFALYSDTIYIPDPILPWIEADREEEKYPIINTLLQAYHLLQLKPLVDASLSYPALLIFPSWEKSLEANDPYTQDRISEIILRFYSFYLNTSFEDENEIIDYITGNGKEDFRDAVEKNRLFWVPNQEKFLPFDSSASLYKKYLETWRSDLWLENIMNWSPERLVYNGIGERLFPQFHIIDNALALNSQPLFWLEPHFHYFQLYSNSSNQWLKNSGVISSPTFEALQSLREPSNVWLGNVPINDIATFRENNLNEEFRRRLSEYLDELNESDYNNLNKVAYQVGRGISSLLVEHNKVASKIADEYHRKHQKHLFESILSLGAVFCPDLSPYIGAIGVGFPLVQTWLDLLHQGRDEKLLSRSLTGILSSAKTSG